MAGSLRIDLHTRTPQTKDTNVMAFPIMMAWRETRAAWRHFLYFFVCIALGVGAVVGISLFAGNVERAVTREARSLSGGDVEVRLSHSMGESGMGVLRSLETRGITIGHASELVAMASTVELASAVSAGPLTQLVELKAVEMVYPLYGILRTEPQRPLKDLLMPPASACPETHTPPADPRHRSCHGALVQESLLIRMGLRIGDPVKIGHAVFRITGVIRKEPDRMANLFSLGPRVMISQQGLTEAQLVKPGSRVRERYLVKTPSAVPVSPLVYELRSRLADESVRVSSYREAQPQLKQFLDHLARYLGLIGLAALFIGGIGVATSVEAFIREKWHSIAILKTLGADTRTIVSIYLGQAVALGFLGSLAGLAVGVALQQVLPTAVVRLLDTDVLQQVEFSTGWSTASFGPLLNGMGLGLLTTVLFTVWPLLGIQEIRPGAIFRREVEPVTGCTAADRRCSWWRETIAAILSAPQRLCAAAGITAGLAALSMWQAGSWAVGLLFLAGLLASAIMLRTAAWLLVRVLQKVPSPRSLTVRQAIGNIVRPGSQAVGIMMSVGIGVMVIVAVGVLERSLVSDIGATRPTDAPTFFFIDIQPDQAEGFARLLQERTGDAKPELTPLVRARLHTINGERVRVSQESDREDQDKGDRGDRRTRWYLSREYVLTFLDRLPKDNTITQGRWWTPGATFERPLVSVEEDAAKHLDLTIGSSLEFEIQGARVEAEVSSIRQVEWGNMSTNFYMILSPGSLEGAPFNYVATARVAPEAEVSLQQAAVASFPNVSAIHIGEVLASFARILDRLSLAIRAVALFCVMTGALVMAAALTATRYRRLYESVILKALGATRGLIVRSFATEYAIVGAVAGFIGVALASVLSWEILYFVFDLPWTLQPELLAAGFLSTVALTLTVGFLSTYRLLGRRPLAVLRHE